MKQTMMIPLMAAAVMVVTGCIGAGGDNHALVPGHSSAAQSAIYSCADGTDFIADFAGQQLTLSIAAGPIVTLSQKPAASGTLYSNASYEFRSKGRNATLRLPGRKNPVPCSSLE